MAKRGKKVLIGLDGNYVTYVDLRDTYHLHLQNSDYAGDVVQDTNYVKIAGSNKMLDLSEAVTGHPSFVSREVKLEMAGKLANDEVLPNLRNMFEGKVCRVRVDSATQTLFFKGRVHFTNIKTEYGITSLTISMPEADPYMYNNVESSIIVSHESSTSQTETIDAGRMLVSPTFEASNIVGTYTVSVVGTDISMTLSDGTNYDPRIKVNGDSAVRIKFTGQGDVTMKYRGGQL